MTKVASNDTGYLNPTLESWNKAIYTENSQNADWYFSGGAAKSIMAGDNLTYKFKGTRISLYAPHGSTGTSSNWSIDDGMYNGIITLNAAGQATMPMPIAIKSGLANTELLIVN